MPTLGRFIIEAEISLRLARLNNPNTRRGQIYFYCLEGTAPDFLNNMRGTEIDPYYNDENIPALLEALALYLED